MTQRRKTSLSPLGITFAGRLRMTRVERNLSQGELAEMSGVGATYISELERFRSEPTLAVVWKLACALGVDPDDMLRQPSPATEPEF